MREYELVIDKAFQNGLSPDVSVPFNSQVLSKALGFRMGKYSIEHAVEMENPLDGLVDFYYSWPFPQMIAGERYKILVIRDGSTNDDKVYTVSEDNSVVTMIWDIAALIYGVGTLMEVADFGEYIFMTNGVVMIYWDPTLSVWQGITSHANIPMMRTICNFKGQLIGGSVVSAWYDCDETFYVWSKVGEMDCTPDEENMSGYRRCPYGGEVMHVRRLGDYVVGYSDKGITILSPVSNPIPTFGFKEVYDRGIINRGAVDGSLQSQVFVDSDYNIVRVVEGKAPESLGYQKFMEELTGEDIIVKYDSREGDYYIGNSTKTFLLTDKGLTEVQQHPSAVWVGSGETYAIPETSDGNDPEIITGIFNMEYSGQKTTATIESDAVLADDIKAAVEWANDLVSWGYGSLVPVNNMGIASITAAGNFLRFRMTFGTLYNGFKISYMKVRFKMTDLRGIRGVYAPPPRGQ